jgi:hypothetical protein
MIDYPTAVLGILAATLIPVWISLYIVSNLKFVKLQYLAMAGIGLTFWFFYDTLGNAAAVGVADGFGGGVPHVGVVIVFLTGIAALAIIDQIAVPSTEVYNQEGNQNKYSKFVFLIPAGLAFVMGMHGFGEGWDFGSAAQGVTTGGLLDAFGGGLGAIVSYLMHKFLEAAIIGVVYAVFVYRNSLAVKAWWHMPVLGLLFGGQSVLGAATGYNISFDTTYFYTFGATSAFYSAIRLAEAANPRFKIGENAPFRLGPLAFTALAIGFLLLYSAALFHNG